MSNQVATIEDIVYSVAETFGQVSVDKSIEFKRESEFAIQVLYGNDYSRKIALANPQSVRDAVTNIAAIGISLNPARKQAYLVPRKKAITLDISYIGMLDMAVASGSIRWGQAEVVHAADKFVLNGFDKPPLHERDPFAADRGDIVGAYCVAKTADGDFLTTTMTIAEVLAIKDRSEAGKLGSGPWKTDFKAMTVKTVVRKASKFWPRSDRLDKAFHYLDTDGDQGIDFAAEQAAQAPVKTSREEWIGKASLAQSIEEMTKISKAGAKAFNEAKDRDGYRAFAEAVQKRGAELRAQEVIDV